MILKESTTRKKNSTQEQIKAMTILGIVCNLNNDGKTYYVAKDNEENYYLFLGEKCSNPNDFYDDMWDDVPV